MALFDLLVISVLLCGNPKEEVSPKPRPRPLEDSFREGLDRALAKDPNQPIFYSLDWPQLLVPPGRWIVAPLIKCLSGPYPPGTSFTCVGVVAVEIPSGKARQLLNPLVPDEFPSTTVWECRLLRLPGQDRCGICFVRKAPGQALHVWEWDLAKNSVTDGGVWPWGLEGLLTAVDRSSCSISWPKEQGVSWEGHAELVLGSKRMELTREHSCSGATSPLAFIAEGSWSAPSDGPGSFVVCKSGAEFEILCEDLQSSKSPRWRISERDLCEEIGVTRMVALVPLDGLIYPCKRLVFAFSGHSPEPETGLLNGFLVVETKTGKFASAFYVDRSPTRNPVVSPSGRYVAYHERDLGPLVKRHFPQMKELIYVVDLKKKSILKLDTVEAAISEPCGFLDDDRFVSADYDALWLWTRTTEHEWNCREFFRLEKAGNKDIESAGREELGVEGERPSGKENETGLIKRE